MDPAPHGSQERSAPPEVGVGLDLVSVGRIRRVLRRSPGFAGYFHPRERHAARGRRDPAAHLALCFAVKEALLKAHGLGIFDGIALRDIAYDPNRGAVRIEPVAAKRLGHLRHLVTTARRGDFAWAFVLAIPDPATDRRFDGS